MSAFVTLYHRHSRSMLNYFYRRLADRRLAEDLVQELFVRVLSAAGRYDPERPFAAWLYALAANLAHDAFRRRATRPEQVSLEALGAQEEVLGAAAARAEMADPHDVVVARLEAEQVRHAVQRLAPLYREIVAERIYAERPFGEIAGRLGVPEATVRRRMHEALRQLRRALLAALDPSNGDGRNNGPNNGPNIRT